MTWQIVVALGIGSYLLRLVGLGRSGGGHRPAWADTIFSLVPAAMLAALITVQTISGDGGYTIDARLPGVAAASVTAGLGGSFVLVVIVGVLVTTALRALGMA